MKYYTVQEISDKVGLANIHEVRQEGKYVVIVLKGGLIAQKDDISKAGEHTSASSTPRIKIRNY